MKRLMNFVELIEINVKKKRFSILLLFVYENLIDYFRWIHPLPNMNPDIKNENNEWTKKTSVYLARIVGTSLKSFKTFI